MEEWVVLGDSGSDTASHDGSESGFAIVRSHKADGDVRRAGIVSPVVDSVVVSEAPASPPQAAVPQQPMPGLFKVVSYGDAFKSLSASGDDGQGDESVVEGEDGVEHSDDIVDDDGHCDEAVVEAEETFEQSDLADYEAIWNDIFDTAVGKVAGPEDTVEEPMLTTSWSFSKYAGILELFGMNEEPKMPSECGCGECHDTDTDESDEVEEFSGLDALFQPDNEDKEFFSLDALFRSGGEDEEFFSLSALFPSNSEDDDLSGLYALFRSDNEEEDFFGLDTLFRSDSSHSTNDAPSKHRGGYDDIDDDSDVESIYGYIDMVSARDGKTRCCDDREKKATLRESAKERWEHVRSYDDVDTSDEEEEVDHNIANDNNEVCANNGDELNAASGRTRSYDDINTSDDEEDEGDHNGVELSATANEVKKMDFAAHTRSYDDIDTSDESDYDEDDKCSSSEEKDASSHTEEISDDEDSDREESDSGENDEESDIASSEEEESSSNEDGEIDDMDTSDTTEENDSDEEDDTTGSDYDDENDNITDNSTVEESECDQDDDDIESSDMEENDCDEDDGTKGIPAETKAKRTKKQELTRETFDQALARVAAAASTALESALQNSCAATAEVVPSGVVAATGAAVSSGAGVRAQDATPASPAHVQQRASELQDPRETDYIVDDVLFIMFVVFLFAIVFMI